MACSVLNHLRNTPFDTIHSILAISLGEDNLQDILSEILDSHPHAVQERLGKVLYYCIGSTLAAHRDWNTMTFLQLEHEARVQGLLGPHENHEHTAWRLRLLLELEARKTDEI